MFKRVLGLLVAGFGLMAGNASAQLNCSIEHNFNNGVFTSQPGNYSINVGPGQNGTLRATNCTAVNSWNWQPGNAMTQSIQITSPSSGSESYTVTGCNRNSQSCGMPVTITIQVVGRPPPDCTLSANPNPVTSGQTVTFTATCNPNATPAAWINYTDLQGMSRESTSLTFTDVAPAVNSSTQRTVTYHGTAADETIGIIRSLVVTINPAPVTQPVRPPTTCALTATPNPVTQGMTTLLTATCTGGDPVTTYAFTGPGNTPVQSSANNTVVVTPPMAGPNNYAVRASNAGGSATAAVQVDVVSPAPTGCMLTASPNPITLGASSTLTAQCSGGGTPSGYRFTAPDGSFVEQQSPTLVVTPRAPGGHTYTMVASTSGGNSQAASVTVTVNAASCAITPSQPNPVQRGASVTLTAACNNNPVTYSWTTPAGPVAGASGPSITVSPMATTTYTVTASNASTNFPLTATAQYTIVVTAATQLAVVAGPTITGMPGRPLSRALQVRATDAQGNPVGGEVVNWSVVNPGANPGAFASPSGSTNAQGLAGNTFTYGSDGGARTLRACLAALPSICADFQVVPGAATIATIVSGTLTGAPGRPLASELQVRVADSAGMPVAGENVNWTVVNPGASPGTFGAAQTGPTDAQGVTRNTFTLGNDTGPRTLRACLVSVPNVCVDFQVSVVVPAAGLTAISGSMLVGAPGQPLTRALQVRATNTQGAPVAGESINWTVVNPGASPGTFAAAQTGPTDAQGLSQNTFTLGSDPGGRTLRACLASQASVCVDFVVQSLAAAVEIPAARIMAPLVELAEATPLTQLSNIRFRLDQLRLRRNPAVIEALRVRVAGQSLPTWNAFVIGALDQNGKPVQQKGGGAAADDPFERLGFFVNGELEFGRQSSTGIQRGFDLNTTGVTAGVDYRLPSDSVIGVAAGFMNSKTDLNDGGGSQGARGYSIAAYGSFVPAPGAYVDVIAHAGNNKYDTRRREPGLAGAPLDFDGNTDGSQFALAVTAGTDISRGAFTLNPYLRVDHVNAKIDGFTESGPAGAIKLDGLTLKTTIITLGGQMSYAVSTSWGVFMPNARLELQRRAQGSGRIVGAQLVADGAINSRVGLETVDRDYGNASVGFSVVFPRGVSGFANFERLFGRQGYGNAKFTMGLRFEF